MKVMTAIEIEKGKSMLTSFLPMGIMMISENC